MKRLLNCTTSEMLAMNGEELKQYGSFKRI